MELGRRSLRTRALGVVILLPAVWGCAAEAPLEPRLPGGRMALARVEGSVPTLYVAAPDGSGMLRIPLAIPGLPVDLDGEAVSFRALRWDPSGSRLAGVLRIHDRQRDRLVIIDPDRGTGALAGPAAEVLTDDLAWVPDGSAVVVGAVPVGEILNRPHRYDLTTGRWRAMDGPAELSCCGVRFRFAEDGASLLAAGVVELLHGTLPDFRLRLQRIPLDGARPRTLLDDAVGTPGGIGRGGRWLLARRFTRIDDDTGDRWGPVVRIAAASGVETILTPEWIILRADLLAGDRLLVLTGPPEQARAMLLSTGGRILGTLDWMTDLLPYGRSGPYGNWVELAVVDLHPGA